MIRDDMSPKALNAQLSGRFHTADGAEMIVLILCLYSLSL